MSVWQLVTLNAFTLDKLIDKRMNSERKLTLLMERATERIGWEAPANSDTTTGEACRAEGGGEAVPSLKGPAGSQEGTPKGGE